MKAILSALSSGYRDAFRRGGNSGPATELRFDRGGGYFILERQ
jgi:hypothetical protein